MDRRIGELLGGCLAAAEGRMPVERLPEPGTEDIAALVDVLHADMAKGEGARAAYAGQHHHAIACKPGCTYCCANLIVVYQPEAIRVAAWLGEPEQRATRRQFERSYPRWRSAVGEDADRLTRLQASGDIEAAEALYAEVQDRHVACAFVVDGLCTIYPVRPNVCRNALALDTPDRCRPGSVERPRAIAFPPLDDFVQQASAVFRVLHRRLQGQAGPATLCDAVHRLLPPLPAAVATPAPARNRPCPCGSGRKFKRCCGS